MNCPDEPDETCPYIDKVVAFLESVRNETPGNISWGETKDMLDRMEVIREANADLRARATYFEEQAEEFEDAKDKAEARADEGDDKIKELEEKLITCESHVCTEVIPK